MSRMPKIIDMTGRVFGKLSVLSRVPATGQARWLCACKCGKQTIQAGYDLRKGIVVSCGCARGETLAKFSTTHGMTRTTEYRAWCNMRNRCSRVSNSDFPRYGGLGITVCQSWKDSFQTFFNDMGKCPPHHSLDRIDPAKGYSPENCRWASLDVQANNKRTVQTTTIDGETLSIAQWCRKLNLSHRTIRQRVYVLGWEPVKALLTPIRKTKG